MDELIAFAFKVQGYQENATFKEMKAF